MTTVLKHRSDYRPKLAWHRVVNACRSCGQHAITDSHLVPASLHAGFVSLKKICKKIESSMFNLFSTLSYIARGLNLIWISLYGVCLSFRFSVKAGLRTRFCCRKQPNPLLLLGTFLYVCLFLLVLFCFFFLFFLNHAHTIVIWDRIV